MRLFRTIAVTFALYSRIPMPHFEWKDEDMRYSIALFPWVGAVIGGAFVCVFEAAHRLQLPLTAVCLLMAAVPLLLTGGFHIDGFMDVSDALSSFGSREERLRILKDPHIGAFAVIRMALCGLIFTASMIIICSLADTAGAGPAAQNDMIVYNTALGFAVSRGLSAMSVLTFRSAKHEGMLYYEATAAASGRRVNIILVLIWTVLFCGIMLYNDVVSGAAVILASLCAFAWYRHMSYMNFGGITGDTAGWFVTVCETAGMAAAAVSGIVLQNI
jgi:adenosylcobinamide-GDP ribazoletransferase